MPGVKTNERPGTRAVLRHTRVAPNKAREVLNLVRNRPVHEAEDVLRFCERDVAFVIGKVLASAVANAEHNDDLDREELFVSACYADEGTTIKRWRPRARGRATRIRKRTTHITIIVSRLSEDRLARLQSHRRAEQLVERSRRVAGARRSGGRGAATEGDMRSRSERRQGTPVEEVTTAEDVSAAQEVSAAEESGIVDQTGEGVAALEEAQADGSLAEIATAEGSGDPAEGSGKTDDGSGDPAEGSGKTDDAKDGR
ncbi:MAG: 50S ribosomal protein L22 [Actinomycetota bacterium]|nr:50S ribosomal protein L22 [Actinomycetota bacterium]